MPFGKSVNRIISFFYICGLSCYPSYDGFLAEENTENRLQRYTPTIGLIVLTTVTSITAITTRFLKDQHAKTLIHVLGHSIVFPVVLLLTLLPCAIQMVFSWPSLATIWSHISIIERTWWEKISDVSKALRRHFMRRVYVMVIVFLVKILMSLFEKEFSLLSIFIVLCLNVLRALIFIVLTHAFFYIDLLDHLMHCFVRQIDARAATPTAVEITWKMKNSRTSVAQQLRADLMHYKSLHFRLWHISEKINDVFGGMICLIFLQYFVFSVYSVYKVYAAMLAPELNYISILREYE